MVNPKPAPFFYYVDRSREEEEDPNSPILPHGLRLNLPCKMHVILDQADLADVVSWMPHGRSWRIHKKDEFVCKILPRYWGECTMKTFLRQLMNWGFLRLKKGQDKDSFYNEYFLRGLPHLCKKMKPCDNIEKKAEKRLNQPDLHAISEMHPLPKKSCGFHMNTLKLSMQEGPYARMSLNHHALVGQKRKMESDDDPDSLDGEQDELSTLLQQPQQNEERNEAIENTEKLIEAHNRLTRWQSFLLSVFQFRDVPGDYMLFLTTWWVRYGTVPRTTEEEIQAEIIGLSRQERMKLATDLYDCSEADPELEEQWDALCCLRSNIDAIPPEEKVELAEASSRCSDFDAYEMLFLQSADFNAEVSCFCIKYGKLLWFQCFSLWVLIMFMIGTNLLGCCRKNGFVLEAESM